MGFNALVANIVKNVADPLLKSFQCEVTIYPWEGDDGFGGEHAPAGVKHKAIVDRMNKTIPKPDGGVLKIAARVTILEEIKVHVAPGRVGSVDPRDRVVLPDGFTGPIIDAPGLLDPATKEQYFAEILIGDPR